MFGQPWYRGYPTHSSYNPYVYSPYQQTSPFDPTPRQSTASSGADAQARARALAAQRARRAQYLPDEVEDEDDDWEYDQLGPRERAYLEAQRRRAILERRQQEEAQAQAQAQAQARQRELEEKEWQEALEQRQREDEEARQNLLEERKRQLKLKREEEARLKAAAAEQGKRHQKQTRARRNSSQAPVNGKPSVPSHQEDTSIPIHARRDSTSSQPPSKPSIPPSDKLRSPSTSRSPTPKSPTPSKYSLEEQNDAAIRIQNQYRIHLSYRTLEDIDKEFETLRKNFVYPRTIDFQKPGGGEGHISVLACRPPSDFDSEEIIEPMDVDGPDGKLDFTSTNFAVNAYSDTLDKLLMKLDGVESWGKRDIRDKRRTIVKTIEREASKLDRYCKQAWIDYLARQGS